MPVYRYKAVMPSREDSEESGTVYASNEEEARKKLRALRFERIHLKRAGRVKSMFGRLTANVR